MFTYQVAHLRIVSFIYIYKYLIEFTVMTLVSKIIQVSGTQFYNICILYIFLSNFSNGKARETGLREAR